jgi:hypothetical protein
MAESLLTTILYQPTRVILDAAIASDSIKKELKKLEEFTRLRPV